MPAGRIWQFRPLQIGLAALVLCWAAIVNGQPFFFPDTQAYVRSVDVAVAKLIGREHASPWLDVNAGAVDQRIQNGPVTRQSYEDSEVIAGRSIYFGVLTYLGEVTGGFWFTVFVQALAVALLADITLRATQRRDTLTYAAVIGFLAFATPAPFYAAFLMPDIWTGLLAGSLALLFAFGDRLPRLETGLLAVMIVFAGVSHNTNILILFGSLGAFALFWLFRRSLPAHQKRAIGFAALALGAGVMGTVLFNKMVEASYGKPPITPPFLTARLQTDEPGLRFIRENCPQAGFTVCRFADRLPLTVNSFIWGKRAPSGVWQTVDSATRRALSEEQFRFALAVIGSAPLAQSAVFAKNAAFQLVTADLEDFNYDRLTREQFSTQVPAEHLARMQQTPAWSGDWPVQGLELFQNSFYYLGFTVILGLIVLRSSGWTKGAGGEADERAALYATAILVCVVFNAIVCGLSELHGRYQARVSWLVPVAAWLLVSAGGLSTLRGAIDRLRGTNS